MNDKGPAANPPRETGEAAANSDRTPLDWPRQTGRLDRVMEAIAVRKERRRHRSQIAGGAAAVLLIAGAGWLSQRTRVPAAAEPPAGSHVIIATPERRTLPDGTIVELKEGSEMTVDFGGALRRVALRRGEAHFQVTKNPRRAFVVDVGGMEFRDVGTAFDVQLSDTQVEMIVTEGCVAVDRAPKPGVEAAAAVPARPPPVLVEAGNRLTVDLAAASLDASQVQPLSSAESEEKLAWRVPRLELNDTPLAEVLAAINQHSPVWLELGDADLGKVEISGLLRADNVETLLLMLESNYGIHGDRREAGKIILRKAR